MPTALRFLALALLGRVAWDTQARHSLGYVRRRFDARSRRAAERRQAWAVLHDSRELQ